jgi:2-dehydro-3-deoxy-D-arabinonate dehydratase
MRLYRTKEGPVVEESGNHFAGPSFSWDELVARDDLRAFLKRHALTASRLDRLPDLLPPIASQEVWGAGVTYSLSRSARMEEAQSAGGGDFYDRVYRADRPELFFKAAPYRVVGSGDRVSIRRDSSWSVPEPELTLLVAPSGKTTGYTIGNDMSARDIEGENPLYLPQAKMYDGSCALGPGIWVSDNPLPGSTEIHLEILRDGNAAFQGTTTLAQMKRPLEILVKYLFSHTRFPNGCFLMTGTGIVPPERFTLKAKDEIRITIEPIGTLVNTVD